MVWTSSIVQTVQATNCEHVQAFKQFPKDFGYFGSEACQSLSLAILDSFFPRDISRNVSDSVASGLTPHLSVSQRVVVNGSHHLTTIHTRSYYYTTSCFHYVAQYLDLCRGRRGEATSLTLRWMPRAHLPGGCPFQTVVA